MLNFNPIAKSVKVLTTNSNENEAEFVNENKREIKEAVTEGSDVFYMTVVKTDPLLTEK